MTWEQWKAKSNDFNRSEVFVYLFNDSITLAQAVVLDATCHLLPTFSDRR